jgi:hypothetical protein
MDIKIDIEDERHFIDVAPVVDRDDFTNEIERLRSVLGVTIPLPDNYFSKPLDQKKEKMIDAEIERSRKTLYLPVVFRSVISSIVFRNEVTDSDYAPAYLVKKSGNFYNEYSTPDETYAIVLSPGARDEDVLKAYQKYRDILGNVKGVPHYKFTNLVWDINKKKPSIKRYRKWYLAAKSGISIKNIADEETENCPVKKAHEIGNNKPEGCTCFHVSTIAKGIETYEKLRLKTPTL